MSDQETPREPQSPQANRLLSLLPDGDIERLRPHLEPISVDLREVLYRAGGVIDHAYFPLAGMASTISTSGDGLTVETLAVAREGTTALPVLLGSDTAPLDVVWQIPGSAVRIRTEVFAAELDRRGAMFRVMQRYAQFVIFAMARAILCARLHATESRAARLLLQSHDSVDSDTFPLTQDYFAAMLGVHRPSLTLAAGLLQGMGAISYRRGVITILDRELLGETTCECYGVVRDHYAERLSA